VFFQVGFRVSSKAACWTLEVSLPFMDNLLMALKFIFREKLFSANVAGKGFVRRMDSLNVPLFRSDSFERLGADITL